MDYNTKYIAYVDETGTNVLNTSTNGESNLFICTAVLVRESDKDDLSERIFDLSQRLCSGAEIKSSRIGKDHKRRLKFLDEIEVLDFNYYALLINKDHIIRDSGLKFKRSYYKYINRMLYERIANNYNSLHVVADTIGGKEYMDSFNMYLKGKRPNLLSRYTHEFSDSATTPLLQLADLISGTLSFCFVDTKKSAHSKQFREKLRPKEIHIESWPLPPWTSQPRSTINQDDALLVLARERASRFVKDNESSTDEFCKMQAEVVKKLLFHQFIDCDHDGCLSAPQLISYLEKLGFDKPSALAFRSRIIGKIRDNGVVISGTSKGYRLAVSEQDIHDYLEHNKKIIEPMLSRLKRAQTVIKTGVSSGMDILENQEFEVLRLLVECYSDTYLELSTERVTHNPDNSL